MSSTQIGKKPSSTRRLAQGLSPGLRRTIALLLGCMGLLFALPAAQPVAAADGTSLRFFGSGAGDSDRVKIPLGPLNDGQITGSHPINVGGDFTIEFWMRAAADENGAPDCAANGWYYGNIIIDRDVDGAGDYGDYGVALCAGRIAFGVSTGEDDRLAVGATTVTDDRWHHIAVTRADGGLLELYVDGQLDAQTAGPTGRIDYRTDRPTNQPNSDPYLVLGAEKHDYAGSFYYNGFLDDLHLSAQVRYTGAFTPPTAPHLPDTATVALYRFDEGAGTTIGDSSGAPGGPSTGTLIVGGAAGGPVWSSDTPFHAPPEAEPPPEPSEPATETSAPPEPDAEPDATPAPPPASETAESTPEPASAEPSPAPPGAETETSTAQPTGNLNPETPETTTPTAAVPTAEATPTDIPQAAITPIEPTAPPPAEIFAPLTWSFVVAGLGLLVSLTTVVLWRRRA